METIECASASIGAVEKYLQKLGSLGGEAHLEVPLKPKFHHLGGMAAYIQLIATWARASPAGKLRVAGASSSEDVRKFFARTLPGIFAGLLLEPERIACDHQPPGDIPRRHALDAAKALSEGRSGPRLWIICADHATLDRPTNIYDTEGRVSEVALNRLLREYLPKAASASRKAAAPRDLRIDLAGVLYELLQNTHEWARTDWDNRRFDASVRGALVQAYARHEIPKGFGHADAEAPRLVNDYYEGLRELPGVVELSVFDCGPGLASRFLGQAQKKIPFDHAVEAVMRSLRLHSTSSDSRFKGVGLHRVLHLLSGLHGLVRIRTGTVSLARDLSAKPLGNDDNCELFDTDTGGKPEKPWPGVSGTLITALVPMVGGGTQPTLWGDL